MVRDPRVPPNPDTTEDAVSEQRRRLLKAAATAAPVIATLPSGAAFANASVHQCVDFHANREQSPANGFLYIPAGPDAYVRAEAVKQIWKDNADVERTVIGWPRGEPDKQWWVESNSGDPLDAWSSFNQSSPPAGWTKVSTNDEAINTLFLWSTDDAGTGFDGQGMWPAQQQGQGTAFGVIQSCLCSVDPRIGPWCV